MTVISPTVDALRRLAVTLDTDDFEVLPTLLEPDCVYEAGRDGTVVGPADITALFRKHSEWGRSKIDVVRFSHVIDPADLTKILFIDDLEHRGHKIRHEITMRVAFSSRGLVRHLRLEYAPGEIERLHAFFNQAGIAGTS